MLRIFNRSFLIVFDHFDRSSSFAVRRRPQVDIKEFAFLEKKISKTQPEERTWAKLVTLKTIHWYYDGPEPMPATVKYEEKIQRRKIVIFMITWSVFILVTNIVRPLSFLSFFLFRNGQRQEESFDQVKGSKEERNG